MATTKAYIPIEEIRDMSPLSLKKLNDNFQYITKKIQGNIGSYDVKELSVDKLVAGNAKISTALIENLEVGTNVTMGPNAYISWENVNGKPNDLVHNSDIADFITTGEVSDSLMDLLNTSNLTTVLGRDFIITGKILTNQIAAGTAKISTALIDDLVVGNNVIMGPNATISWNNVTETDDIPLRSDLTWNNVIGKPTNLLTQPELITALSDYVTNGTMTDALTDTLNLGNFSTIINKDYIASMNLVVGNEILMGANATISWLNVNNKPFIPATAADVDAIPTTYIDAHNVFTAKVYGENIRGSRISTSNFTGTGDYIELYRQYLTFWDNSDNLMKMAMGFVDYGSGITIPGIVFGAGDQNGRNRGYITKDTDSLDIYYIDSSAAVSAVSLHDGKIYLNDTEIPAFDPSSPLPYQYLQNGAKWNNTLNKIQSNGNIDWTLMPPPTALQVGARPYDWNPAWGDISGIKPAQNADNTISIIGADRLTYIDPNGIYTGILTAQQINAVQGITLGSNATINWAQVAKPTYTAGEVGALSSSTHIPTTSEITQITANYVATPNLITDIANVHKTLTLGTGYESVSSIVFAEQASIDCANDVITVSAMGGCVFDAGTHVTFGSSVDFTGATVTGLNVIAKLG